MAANTSKQKKPKITSRKYEGDDMYSWAIFVNDQPVMTGLSRDEMFYYKDQIKKKHGINTK